VSRHRHSLVELLFPGPHLCDAICHLLEKLMSQTEDLRTAIAELGTDLGEAVTRIEAKLADADVDISAEIAQLHAFGDSLDALAADPAADPAEGPVDPPVDPEAPVEP
jgi:hypothetical protein